MRRGRLVLRGAFAAVLVLAGIQLVPATRTNPPVVNDVAAPRTVDALLRRACYDCHSNETTWPWYSRLAPASWLVVRHVAEGRDHLNFSQWPVADLEAQDHLRREIVAVLRKGEMPLRSYRLAHPTARLNAAEIGSLVAWATGE